MAGAAWKGAGLGGTPAHFVLASSQVGGGSAVLRLKNSVIN